jgi:lipopolysaccharide transport system ATP-binding protein
MALPVIQVQGLWKDYVIGSAAPPHDSFREMISGALAAPFRRKRAGPAAEERRFWALRDVSFEIAEGSVVGIIGRNAAGKSTLLKVLSRITAPTRGAARIRGRVASLLEVGTGFHPELTGRENIYLNGAILGMTRAEIRRKFDEIVAFAEIDRFLDTPVKRYSSGMYVRLAFAVAAHLDSDVLIVDEVLAVGDAEFQKKCLGKMGDVSGKEGRTVLLVSHNLVAIQRLCRSALYLDAGVLRMAGSTAEALEAYQLARSGNLDPAGRAASLGAHEMRIVGWKLTGAQAAAGWTCRSRDRCRFVFTLRSGGTVDDLYIGFALWSSGGELILGASSLDHPRKHYRVAAGTFDVMMECRVPIRAGTYVLEISLNSKTHGQLDRWTATPHLHVLPAAETHLSEQWQGIVSEDIEFHPLQAVSP